MRSNSYNRISAIAMAASLLFVTTSQAMAACNWTRKVTLADTASSQPGATVFSVNGQTRLFIGFAGTDSNHTVNIESAADGFTFQNKVSLPAMQTGYGVGLGGSSTSGSCDTIYLGYVGGDSLHSLNFAKSSDGISWSGQYSLGYAGYTGATATPQIVEGDTTLVSFSFSQLTPYNNATSPIGALGSFDCNIGSVTAPNYYVYSVVSNPNCQGYPYCGGNSSGSVGWGYGLYLGQLASLLSIAEPNQYPISFAVNNGQAKFLGTNWSNFGDTATFDGDNGNFYVAWHGSGGSINIAKVNLSSQFVSQETCSDSSPSAPEITYFNSHLFLIWRGQDSRVNVASLNPF